MRTLILAILAFVTIGTMAGCAVETPYYYGYQRPVYYRAPRAGYRYGYYRYGHRG
jgi:hypothetical protein